MHPRFHRVAVPAHAPIAGPFGRVQLERMSERPNAGLTPWSSAEMSDAIRRGAGNGKCFEISSARTRSCSMYISTCVGRRRFSLSTVASVASDDWATSLTQNPKFVARNHKNCRPKSDKRTIFWELRQMARFYFHKHQDGRLIEDHKGRSFPNERAACRHAFREVADIIGRIGSADDQTGTYVGIEVHGRERTRCIVRAFIVVEHPR
jgi:hypothetical protein